MMEMMLFYCIHFQWHLLCINDCSFAFKCDNIKPICLNYYGDHKYKIVNDDGMEVTYSRRTFIGLVENHGIHPVITNWNTPPFK